MNGHGSKSRGHCHCWLAGRSCSHPAMMLVLSFASLHVHIISATVWMPFLLHLWEPSCGATIGRFTSQLLTLADWWPGDIYTASDRPLSVHIIISGYATCIALKTIHVAHPEICSQRYKTGMWSKLGFNWVETPVPQSYHMDAVCHRVGLLQMSVSDLCGSFGLSPATSQHTEGNV